MEEQFVPEGLSKLHFYSYGIVGKNKDLDSDEIEVDDIENSGFDDKEITDNITKVEGEGKDHNGKTFKTTVETTNTIKAKWLSFTETNRMSSPDVRRGEEVAIWRFGDTDQFWWTTLKQDRKLRRLETVIYGFSNLREENTKGDHTNMYWLEVSTHRKVVRFHTPKNDGEFCEWDIQLDTKNGVFTIEDDNGNYFMFDSKNLHLKMKNKDESFIEINKKNAKIFTKERVDIETKIFEVKASQKIKETTKTYEISTNTYKLVASTYTCKSSSWMTTVPVAKFSATVKSGANVYWGGISFAKKHVPDAT